MRPNVKQKLGLALTVLKHLSIEFMLWKLSSVAFILFKTIDREFEIETMEERFVDVYTDLSDKTSL